MLHRCVLSALAAASLLSSASAQIEPTPTYHGPMNALTEKGCFSDSQPLQDHGSYTFQSSGNCQGICYGFNKPVMGLVNGTNCFCGDLMPEKSKQVDASFCNTPCDGFNKEMCGGANYWRVILTGSTANQIGYLDVVSATSSSATPAPTSASASSPAAKPTSQNVVTIGGSTVVMTVPGQQATAAAPTQATKSSSGPSTTGIAVGVVVGVIALAALIGAVFLILRRRRQRRVEDDYKRQASIATFSETGKPPGTSHSSLNDSRLDPEAMMRRQSDGSIADNHDYSRKILRVANPDGMA